MSSDVELEPGAVIGQKYRLEAEIGAGGMGRVFAAEHLLLRCPVALKLLPPGQTSAHRLLREARAAQSLRSENAVRVHDVGLEAGRPYIVMERLEGCNLSQLVASRGPLPVAEAVDYVIQACAPLAEAHAAGIVHRDVKPSNLFLARRPDGSALIKVLDFGISKTPFAEVLAGERTADNALLGSPAYMSPEQLRHASRVDGRTDVWALAVTLYWLLTGVHPFQGPTFLDVSLAIATEPHPPLARCLPAAPAGLDDVLARALAKRPEDRVASVRALAEALAPFAPASAVGHAAAVGGVVAGMVSLSSSSSFSSGVRADATATATATDQRVAVSLASAAGAAGARRRWRKVPAACAVAVLVGVASWLIAETDEAQALRRPPVAAARDVAPMRPPVPAAALTTATTPPPAPASAPAGAVTPAAGPPADGNIPAARPGVRRPRPPRARPTPPPAQARPTPPPAHADAVPVAAPRAARLDGDGIPIIE